MNNRWHVYCYLKQHPAATEMVLRSRFSNLSQKEIREGVKEFQSIQEHDPNAVQLTREFWGSR